MATLTYNGIVESVLRLMDENGGHASFMSSDDATSEMKEVIRQVTEQAVRNMHLKAPVFMLDGVSWNPQLTPMNAVFGRFPYLVELPSDFFRLIKCRLYGWKRPVTQLWWEDSAEYAKQRNRFLMGTEERPMAFLVHWNNGQRIELYSSEWENDSLSEFVYLPKPSWSANTSLATIDASDRLVDACLMQVAADTLIVLGETERAQMMAVKALESINTYGGMERHYSDIGNRVEK